jgi:DNA helicase-2/ATP-dependent DNA helicase PcrA
VISRELASEWKKSSTYHDAIRILDSSISKSLILSQDKTLKGINVITLHKAKGKDIDGVIIFQNSYCSPFVAKKDTHPFRRSKKLLFVGITRAKYHTLIIQDPSEKCGILKGFVF